MWLAPSPSGLSVPLRSETRQAASLLELLLGFEIQRSGVHAIAQPGRFRAVGEDVSEMSVATGATGFGAGHAVRAVGVFAHVLLVGRGVEAGPTGAGIEFGFGIEQRCAAGDALIHPRLVVVPVLAAEGTLGARFARHVVLLGCKLLAPFGFGFRYFFGQFFGHILSSNKMREGLESCERYARREIRSG